MNTLAVSLVKGDLPWFGLVRDVEDFESGLGFLFRFVALVVDQHLIAAHANFVGVNPFRHFELSDCFTQLIAFFAFDDGCAVRWVYVADVGIAVFDDYGASARKVRPADLFNVLTYANRRFAVRSHGSPPLRLSSLLSLRPFESSLKLALWF